MENNLIGSEKTLINKASNSIFTDIDKFEDAQRMALALCKSDFVPEFFRGSENLGNVIIAMNISRNLNVDILYIMKHIKIVREKPTWEAKFLIALVNMSGNLEGRLNFKSEGDETWAYGIDAETGALLEGPKVSIAMAKAEGWYDRKGSKWKTMPEMMKTYRAASFFVNTFMPEVTSGMRTDFETIDIDDSTIESNYITPIKSDNTDVPRETIPEEPDKSLPEKPQEELMEDTKDNEPAHQDIAKEAPREVYTTTMGQENSRKLSSEFQAAKFKDDIDIAADKLIDKNKEEPAAQENEITQSLIKNIHSCADMDELQMILADNYFINLPFSEKNIVMAAWREKLAEINKARDEQGFFDERGQKYDPKIHAWSSANNKPAYKADGSFRKRRGVSLEEPRE